MASRQAKQCYLDSWARIVAKKRKEEAHLLQWRQAEVEAAAARAAKAQRAKEAEERRKAAFGAERKRRLEEAQEEKWRAEAAFKEAQARYDAARQQTERAAAAAAASPGSPPSTAAGSTSTRPPEALAPENPATVETSSGRPCPCWICQHPDVRKPRICPNRASHVRFRAFKGWGRGHP